MSENNSNVNVIQKKTVYEIDCARGWKICNKCQIIKDLYEFHNTRNHGKVVKRNYCKTCSSILSKQKYIKRPKRNLSTRIEKMCSRCKQIKNINEFWKQTNSVDGRQCYCKQCTKIIDNIKSQTEKRKEQKRIYQKSHKEDRNITRRKWYQNLDNKRKARASTQKWRKNELKTNPIFKLSCNLRTRIWEVLKRNSKSAKTEQLLGCSFKEFKQYLESKFLLGMHWDNYGNNGWHIDHIIPCSSFDLSKPEEQHKCFHYSNLQPLWATKEIAEKYGCFNCVTNLEKSDKIIY